MQRIVLFLSLLIHCHFALAQQDSMRIENRARRKVLRDYLWHQVYHEKDSSAPVNTLKYYSRRDYEPYRGFPIRRINIDVTDPFGFEINDTLPHHQDGFQRFGNGLHNRTKKNAVRNFLLFQIGDPLDPYKLTESVRLLRSSGIFRNALLIPVQNGDSVDIYLRVLDKWSITGKYTATSSFRSLRIEDRNFMGLDHHYINNIQAKPVFDPGGYSGSYEINRIENTFINAKIIYGEDLFDSRRSAISLERPFYSPLTKWAGGLTAGQYRMIDRWYVGDTVWTNKGLVYNNLDAWLSRSILLSQTNARGVPVLPRKNLILSLRNQNNRFLQTGSYRDSLRLYRDQSWVLGMFAVSVIDYEAHTYINRFGDPEYLSVGSFMGLIGGYDPWTESGYVGFRLGLSHSGKNGYYLSVIEAGKTIATIIAPSELIKSSLLWLSPLWTPGSWRIRQFVRPEIILGREIPINKRLTFSDGSGIGDYKSGPQNGTCSMGLSLQTQIYTPWEVLGFRFGPVLFYSGTKVSDTYESLGSSRYYSTFGLGLLMKNERLVVSTFQLSVSFFPYLSNFQESARINNPQAWEFGLGQLVTDKPGMVAY